MNQRQQVKKRKIFYYLITLGIILGVFIYSVLYVSSKQVIESHAILVAEIVALNATSSRSVYAKEIISKLKKDGFGPHLDSKNHKGYVPIPAQFLKLIGRYSSEKHHKLFTYKPVSKWNIEPTQGLSDDFLKWAWGKIELKNKNNPQLDKNLLAVWRIESKGNSKVLRYMYPDLAVNSSCVTCHNQYEKMPEIIEQRKKQGLETGKQWQKGDLIGALSITVPLEKVENLSKTQIQNSTLLLTITITLSLLLIAWFTRRNVRQQNQLEDLDWDATHDPLTGLLNRRGLENIKHKTLLDTDKNQSFICFIDLDKFKPVNDTYGHKAGDKLLIAIAKALKNATTEQDHVVRLGGDEFVIILCCTPSSNAETEGLKILHAVQGTKIIFEETEISVTASIGLAKINSIEKGIAESLENADKASYDAKESGRNNVVVYN